MAGETALAQRAFVLREALDFSAHASMGFLLLVAAWLCGCHIMPAGAIIIAWGCGFVRECTEWQWGNGSPFRPPALLDQTGWIFGGLSFIFVTA